ncbi:MAG: energy transducer TonB [Bacteroidota bacterium]
MAGDLSILLHSKIRVQYNSKLFRQAQVAIVGGRKNGVWKGDTNKGTYEEVYENGKLIEGVQLIDDKKYTYTAIAVQPEFDGGLPGLSSFISSNLVYPRKARRMGTQGNVFIEFVIDKDGKVINIKMLKGIGPECDAEALRVISIMPKWNPGLLRGTPVKVRFVLPIKYVLG